MATVPTDVVTENELRFNLRLPLTGEDGEEHANLSNDLQGFLGEAVSFVEGLMSAPILDVTGYCEVPVCAKYEPVTFRLRNVRGLSRILSWSNHKNRIYGIDPDVELIPSSRITKRETIIYPVVGGWSSATLQAGYLRVEITRGLDPLPKGVKSAIISAARQRYDGVEEIRPTNAIYAWTMPFKSGVFENTQFVTDDTVPGIVIGPIGPNPTITHEIYAAWSGDINNPGDAVRGERPLR